MHPALLVIMNCVFFMVKVIFKSSVTTALILALKLIRAKDSLVCIADLNN